MFDIGWTELLLIGIVALIVVGPRDLPVLFRALGRMTAKARAMAREFSSAMDDAARDSGLDEASKSLRDVKNLTSKKSLGLDRLEKAVDKFEKWDPKIPSSREGLKPDPAKPAAGAKPGPSPAPGSAAMRKSADAAKGQPAAQGPAHAPVQSAPSTAQSAAPNAPEHAPGQRRLHAVRRRDSKES
ncbi:MAG: Sec-independent protein translocase protein TatB [Paracoccus sp. (in: a-proteobacteria)]|nr:Sec-independent protein translocase protein TatB [Paracoccus sp. (in: a-proteobacteria)]